MNIPKDPPPVQVAIIDQEATCPYNPEHKMSNRRLIYHLGHGCVDKQKNWRNFKTCPFNALHILHKNDFDEHSNRCSDRPPFDSIIYDKRLRRKARIAIIEQFHLNVRIEDLSASNSPKQPYDQNLKPDQPPELMRDYDRRDGDDRGSRARDRPKEFSRDREGHSREPERKRDEDRRVYDERRRPSDERDYRDHSKGSRDHGSKSSHHREIAPQMDIEAGKRPGPDQPGFPTIPPFDNTPNPESLKAMMENMQRMMPMMMMNMMAQMPGGMPQMPAMANMMPNLLTQMGQQIPGTMAAPNKPDPRDMDRRRGRGNSRSKSRSYSRSRRREAGGGSPFSRDRRGSPFSRKRRSRENSSSMRRSPDRRVGSRHRPSRSRSRDSPRRSRDRFSPRDRRGENSPRHYGRERSLSRDRRRGEDGGRSQGNFKRGGPRRDPPYGGGGGGGGKGYEY